MELGEGLQGADGQAEHVKASRVLPQQRRVLGKLTGAASEPEPSGGAPVPRVSCGVLRLPGALASAHPGARLNAGAEVHKGKLRKRPQGGIAGAACRSRRDEKVASVHVAVVGDTPIVEAAKGGSELRDHRPCNAGSAEEGVAIVADLVHPGPRSTIACRRRHSPLARHHRLSIQPVLQRAAGAPGHGGTKEVGFGGRGAHPPDLEVQKARGADCCGPRTAARVPESLHHLDFEGGPLQASIGQDTVAAPA
mmetsp:Transcript_41849/g.91242  ORF Transcript_41849/g.91242 Transcript_41849/m.91242 type:complete len:251 (+) Transcript_41849:230-982(+)